MKFVVEKIIDDKIVLEDLNKGTQLTVQNFLVSPIIKESDIVIFEDGVYNYSEEETLKRKEHIKEMMKKLKRNNN